MSEDVETIANSTVKKVSQLNIDTDKIYTPSYKYHRIYQMSGGTNVDITTAGGEQSVFEIPPQVFNLARSYLCFTAQASDDPEANYRYVAFKDCMTFIQKIEFYTQSNAHIDEINYVPEFTKLIWKPETSYAEYNNFPLFDDGVYFGQMLAKSNAQRANNLRPSSLGELDDSSPSNISYVEPEYVELATDTNQEPLWNIKFPLGMLYYSLASLDKDIYFNETFYMRITWSASIKTMYIYSSLQGPPAGTINRITAPQEIKPTAEGVSIRNLYLYIAQETNENAIALVKNSVLRDKFSVYCPSVDASKLNTGAVADSSQVMIRYGSSKGQRLCKILWAYFAQNNVTKFTYETDVTGDGKIIRFHTELNDSKIQDYDLEIANHDHYFFQKDRLEGSIILSENMYSYNFAWIDSFMTSLPYHQERKMIYNTELGIPTGLEDLRYSIVVPAQASPGGNGSQWNVFIYGIFQKTLRIGPGYVMMA